MRSRRRSGRQQYITRRIQIIGAAVAAVLVILFLCMSFYFRNHFYFHTQINGLKVGGMTAEKAEEKIAKEVGDYLLTIFDRNGNKYHIMGRDIDGVYVPDGSLKKALKKPNRGAWIPSVFKKNQIDVETPMTYDKSKLEAAVAALSCFKEENIVPPVSAKIERRGDSFVIVPEEPGTQLIREKVIELVGQAVTAGEGTLTLPDDAYVAPEAVSDSPAVVKAMAAIENCLKAGIVYKIADYDEKLTKKEILPMIEIGEDFSVTLNEKKVTDYVQKLASKYNTYGDERQFKTSSGDTVTIGGGDYGWVINKPKEAEQLIADVLSGQTVTREPMYSQRAKVEGFDDIGTTYVEIDYTKQHMWYYEEGQLVLESDIVTGNISKGNGSPDGIFKIVYKQSPAVLKGEDYESNVTYFLPFAYNVGFHDASWRTNFGGTYYKTGGSHGCVNMPGNAAKELYSKIQVDTPVVAYYREKVELTAENCRIANAYSYVKPTVQPDR